MPIYNFKCQACGFEQEKLQKYNDPSPICEHSDHGEMVKQFNRPAFHFTNGQGTDRGLLWSIPSNT